MCFVGFTGKLLNILCQCFKTNWVWFNVQRLTGIQLHEVGNLDSGVWLEGLHSIRAKFTSSIAALTIWFVCKATCNLLFRGTHPNYWRIASSAVEHVLEYSQADDLQMRKFFVNHFRTGTRIICLFIEVSWRLEGSIGGGGFAIVDTNSHIFLAGCGKLEA